MEGNSISQVCDKGRCHQSFKYAMEALQVVKRYLSTLALSHVEYRCVWEQNRIKELVYTFYSTFFGVKRNDTIKIVTILQQ